MFDLAERIRNVDGERNAVNAGVATKVGKTLGNLGRRSNDRESVNQIICDIGVALEELGVAT